MTARAMPTSVTVRYHDGTEVHYQADIVGHPGHELVLVTAGVPDMHVPLAGARYWWFGTPDDDPRPDVPNVVTIEDTTET